LVAFQPMVLLGWSLHMLQDATFCYHADGEPRYGHQELENDVDAFITAGKANHLPLTNWDERRYLGDTWGESTAMPGQSPWFYGSLGPLDFVRRVGNETRLINHDDVNKNRDGYIEYCLNRAIVYSTLLLSYFIQQVEPSLGVGTLSVSPTLYYSLTAKCSGKVLDVANGGTANGTNVQQWGWNGSDAQLWRFELVPNMPSNCYRVINKGSGKCLEVSAPTPEAAKIAGVNVQIWEKAEGYQNQLWLVTTDSSGYWKLTNVLSGLCLDVDNASVEWGANVEQWMDNGTWAQRWVLVPQ